MVGPMTRPFVAFHFALVQDVAVLRPLVEIAASLPSHDVRLLVSDKFASRDDDGRWAAELDKLGSEIGAAPHIYNDIFDCLRILGPGRGKIFAGSESEVVAHRDAHELFRALPGRVRTITLQHGLECVGFLHNRRHDLAAGRSVRFAADLAVAWFERDRLHAVAPSEQNKIYVAGPTALIDPPSRRDAPGSQPGLVCENLHSVRFAHGRLRNDFLGTFIDFAHGLNGIGEKLVLRPHPAGRFTDRSGTVLPDNVEVSRSPLYAMDLTEFAFAISAPSTILFDFALAGVPVATWIDLEGDVDSTNFAGLPQVATFEDWWRFQLAAKWHRSALIEQQDTYLQGLGIPDDVRGRYTQLVAMH